MQSYEKLLASGFVGKLKLRNRMIATATVTDMAGEDGLPTEQFTRYHEEKARGGWGLVITEDYAITPEGRTHRHLPGLWDDSQIAPHREFVSRVHAAGGTIAAQLFHPGRAAGRWAAGDNIMGPSPLRDPAMAEVPREMTREDIRAVIEAFAAAARRVQACGFDAVEIHGAHGYLINQFLSGFSNKRCDEYGGSVTNRARFAVEIVRAVRDAVGPDYPISFRFSVCDHVSGGIEVVEARIYARMLEEAGVDLLNCSQGMPSSREVITPPADVASAHYAPDAAAVKAAVNIPTVVVGRIADPEVAEELLVSGVADFVGMGRAAIADPQFPTKVAQGRPEDVIRCIACLRGCAGESRRGHCVHCVLNPRVGREVEYDERFGATSTSSVKRVLVAGGGIAGMQAALTAAELGHDVTLFESSDQLGGQWKLAAMPPGKTVLATFSAWQIRQLSKTGVKVVLNAAVTAKTVESFVPDAVIVATGSVPFVPPVNGLDDNDLVVDARDVLSGAVYVSGSVAVLGGGLVGAETAAMLAGQGCELHVVEMGSRIAADCEPIPRAHLLCYLNRHKVRLHADESVSRVEGGTVYVMRESGEEFAYEGFDRIVTAFGSRSDDSLAEKIRAAGYAGVLHVVGDAFSVASGFENIRDAYEAAKML